jgi:hypothetical protein
LAARLRACCYSKRSTLNNSLRIGLLELSRAVRTPKRRAFRNATKFTFHPTTERPTTPNVGFLRYEPGDEQLFE